MSKARLGGYEIAWRASGDGAPVVAIHSSGMSSRQWKKLEAELAPRHRVVLPDLIGYGESSPIAVGERFHFSIDQLAIERVVDELGPVHLVGHSYGGFLALLVALHRPRAVRSVAVYEPVSFGVLRLTGDAEALATVLPGDESAPWPKSAPELEAWLEGFIDYWNGPGGWRALAEPVRETFRLAGPKVIGEVRSLGVDRTPHEAYSTLQMPVLLLGGERSTLAADRVLGILARTIPNATRHAIAGAGHMGPLTHAAEVNARIAAHLAACP